MNGDLTDVFANIFAIMFLTSVFVGLCFAVRGGMIAFYKYSHNVNDAEYAYLRRRRRLFGKIRTLEYRPEENAAELETLRGKVAVLEEDAKKNSKIHFPDVVGWD